MRGVAAALAAIVVAGTLTYGALGAHLRGPSVFADELIYMDATRAVAAGHRPVERDRSYGRGPLYPVVAAPVFALAADDRDAYRALKWFNAFLFALAAVPVYFLARRLLGTRWSVGVAGLSVAIPSALYSGMVLTESIAYLTSSLALLAVALALERPTARRQLVALGAVAVAALARPQLAVLEVAFPLGLGVRWLMLPAGSRPTLGVVRRLWPTAAAVGGLAVLAVAALASGHANLKDYNDVFTSYEPLSVAKWSWYTLAGLALYLAVVPVAAAPAAVLHLWRRGSARDGAFLGLFLSASVLTILVVAAFSSASFGFQRLHDRYLFYVVPLWLVLFASWLERGARSSLTALAAGGALVLALLATLPTHLLERDGAVQFDAVATALWARIRDLDPARPGVFRLVLLLAALAGIAALLVPGRLRPALLAPLLLVFACNAAIVWDARAADADRNVYENDRASTWSWVDHAVPDDHAVTAIYAESACWFATRDAFRWTEFFSERIGPVIRLGLPAPPGVVTDGTNGEVAGDGTVRVAGSVLRPGYVVTSPGLQVRGRPVAHGTLAGLRLWRVDGPLRMRGVRSNAEAVAVPCSRGAP